MHSLTTLLHLTNECAKMPAGGYDGERLPLICEQSLASDSHSIKSTLIMIIGYFRINVHQQLKSTLGYWYHTIPYHTIPYSFKNVADMRSIQQVQ